MATEPIRDSTLIWHKSSASADGGNCVQITRSESSVLVRDSADQSGALLTFSPTKWRGFIRRIKYGKPTFD
jgi:Domain of unknown function (DUF397)